MSESRLESFLAHARQEGTLDSSGTFTVQLRQLALKLGRDLIARHEGAYLLKVIQAGVAAGSEHISIRTDRKHLIVSFGGQGPSRIGTRLASAIVNPGTRKDADPLKHLALGLLSALASGATRLDWCCYNGQVGERLSIKEETIEIVELSDSPFSGAQKSGYLLRVERSSKLAAAESAITLERCGYCPVPLQLNGQKIDGRGWLTEPERPSNWLRHRLPSTFRLAETYLTSSAKKRHSSALSLPPAELRKARYRDSALRGEVSPDADALLLFISPEQEVLRGAVAIEASLSKRASFRWVQFGVCLDREDLDLGCLGVLAVVEASHLKTDVSGFRLIEDRHKLAEIQGVKRRVELLLSKLRPALGALRTQDSGPLRKAAQKFTGGLSRLLRQEVELARSFDELLGDFNLRYHFKRRLLGLPGGERGMARLGDTASQVAFSNRTGKAVTVLLESWSHIVNGGSKVVVGNEMYLETFPGAIKGVTAIVECQFCGLVLYAEPGQMLSLSWDGEFLRVKKARYWVC